VLNIKLFQLFDQHFACRFQRNQRENDPSAEEEFERICSEAMFRIHILEQRLASHEECALQKFQELDLKLSGRLLLG